MPMSPERRAEIQAAVDHTTPGPWEADTETTPNRGVWQAASGGTICWINWDHQAGDHQPGGDLAFIAGSRQWVPELLEDLDELEAEVAQHAAIVEDIHRLDGETMNYLQGQINAREVEITGLKARLAEWEKYTGFLYAHGFFRDPPNAGPPSTLTTIEDTPHGTQLG